MSSGKAILRNLSAAAWSKVEFYFSLPESGAQGAAYGPALRGSSGCRPFYWLHFVSDPADTQVLLLTLVFLNEVEIMHLLGKNILFVLNSLTLVNAKDGNIGWCSVYWLLYKLKNHRLGTVHVLTTKKDPCVVGFHIYLKSYSSPSWSLLSPLILLFGLKQFSG